MWILNYAQEDKYRCADLDGLLYLLGRINKTMRIMYPDDEPSD